MKVDLLHEMEFEKKHNSANPWDKMTSILFSSKVQFVSKEKKSEGEKPNKIFAKLSTLS